MTDQDDKDLVKEGPVILEKKLAAAKLPPLQTDAVVDGWFMEWFPNSPIARSDECWQLLHRAVIDLKQRLKGEDNV